jgi:hypothetical protein
MNKTRLCLVSLILLVVCSPANSVSEFEQWKRQQQQSYQQYRDERDREFTAFLEEHWREIELMKGFVQDKKPKPEVIPVAKPRSDELVMQPVPEVKPAEKPVEPVVIVPQSPPPLKPLPMPIEKRKGIPVHIDYFATPVTFYYDAAFNRSLRHRLNQAAISRFWSYCSHADYESLLEQLDQQKIALQLNDWGYVVLLNKLAEQVYPSSDNSQALFIWFMLIKSGYKSRVAYDESNIYLLIPSTHRIYDVTYFIFDNERYYAVSFDGSTRKAGSVYTYDGHYPGAVNKIDMTIRARQVQGPGAERRLLSFDFGGRHYDIEAGYDKAYLDFLDTYPQLDLEVYFESEVGEAAQSPLLQQLAKELEGMSELEAVNFLLRFVQTALQYKTDEMHFGRENYLLPDETIYYPYSDCEDRSVLFAWLVKGLLGLDMVALDYPGHVATAVRLVDVADGDHVNYNGKRYTVADPTYINATAGMTMPEYRDIRPDVIPIH